MNNNNNNISLIIIISTSSIPPPPPPPQHHDNDVYRIVDHLHLCDPCTDRGSSLPADISKEETRGDPTKCKNVAN